ncbi:hypothetical protein ASD56_05325 [Microbacterium sp. Root166]|uniref:hypothetical protein n=1 Tax=Microbacterium sp. Root166 TaxID=1736478 RepID=UPI0006F4786E|nr:hypothetical protein [Microbacterium sp. Root166]KQZ85714.1 hypothetical protein ASD56_05325 [Microbacterium sp. Root166]
MPATIVVELNMRAEKSSSIPRREKWRCHHSGSLVVRMATATPTTSVEIAARLNLCTGSVDALAAVRAGRTTLWRSGSARRVNGLTFCVCADPAVPIPSRVPRRTPRDADGIPQ